MITILESSKPEDSEQNYSGNNASVDDKELRNPLTPGTFSSIYMHLCRGNENLSDTPGTLVGDYNHISRNNENISDSPGNFTLEFPNWLAEGENMPEAEEEDSLLDYIGLGRTGIEIFYSTSDLPKKYRNYQEGIEALKLKAMRNLTESSMQDTVRGFAMNFIAHKGMFPGSDLVFGTIGALEGLKSDVSRNEIDFSERYKNLYEEHVGVSAEEINKMLNGETKTKENEQQMP
jgi:hypothetical protein